MTNTPHELAEEFPEHVQKIHDLKLSDAHFMRLAEDYHVLNRSIHRAETGTEPVSQFTEAEMRKPLSLPPPMGVQLYNVNSMYVLACCPFSPLAPRARR